MRGYIILTLVQGLALGARVARAGFRSKLHIWFLDIVYHYIKAYNTRCLENLPFGGRGFESHCLLLFFFINFFIFIFLNLKRYALSAPIGVAIGIGIESAIGNDSKTYSIVNGIFQGLSAGN